MSNWKQQRSLGRCSGEKKGLSSYSGKPRDNLFTSGFRENTFPCLPMPSDPLPSQVGTVTLWAGVGAGGVLHWLAPNENVEWQYGIQWPIR